MADRRGQPLVVLNPDRGSIWGIAMRIAAISVGAVLLLSLMLTLGPRLFPGQLRFHPGATAYGVLAVLAILLALTVVLLAQVYIRNVSIQVWADVLVVSDFRAGRRAIALDGALAAERVPVVFEWLFLKLRWKYLVLVNRSGASVQTLDIAEWSEPAIERLFDQLGMSGVSVHGDWADKSLDLISGLGRRYPGATRLRSGPYSLVSVSIAILIFGAGVLVVLPFSIG
jgi:hypothetical protein